MTETFDDKTLKIRELLNVAFELAGAIDSEYSNGEVEALRDRLLKFGFTEEELKERLYK